MLSGSFKIISQPFVYSKTAKNWKYFLKVSFTVSLFIFLFLYFHFLKTALDFYKTKLNRISKK